MMERDDFVQALAKNEDDAPLRLVFADWLDENGEHEEADRQRKWPAAKEWFVRFSRENNPKPDEPDTDERPISYERLIEMGREAVAGIFSRGKTDLPHEALMQMLQMGWETLEKARLIEPAAGWKFGFSCGNNMDMTDALREHAGEYWRNWSIITGIPVPPGAGEKSSFYCAC